VSFRNGRELAHWNAAAIRAARQQAYFETLANF